MNKTMPIDENELSNVSGGVTSNEQAVINIDEGCEQWKCNICVVGLKWNYSGSQAAPSCKHYAFTSCRNCQYFNMQSNSCCKKI